MAKAMVVLTGLLVALCAFYFVAHLISGGFLWALFWGFLGWVNYGNLRGFLKRARAERQAEPQDERKNDES